jgi:hypothetical protein
MGNFAHQIDRRLVGHLEQQASRCRASGQKYRNREEEDFVKRTKERVAYTIQRYTMPNPSSSKCIVAARPYVERYAVHRVRNDGRVSMLVGEFLFLGEAEEYVRNAMLGRMVFGGSVFNVAQSGLVTAGGVGVVGGAGTSNAVLGTKTLSTGEKLMVQLQ